MIVTVKLFAAARQLVGAEAVEVELPPEATVRQLREALVSQFPALADLVRTAMFAVNLQFAGEDTNIPPDAEVACIPPVSGG